MKTILITGAAQGIGYHAAVTLAAMGHTVFALVRPSSDRSKLDAAQAELKTLHVLVADVTDSASIDTAIASALSISKRMDVVVNNACHVVIGTCETCALAEQMTSMDVNYFGPVRVLQAVLPLMRKQRSGKVINISSIAGYEPFPHLEAYVASKWALEGLSESLAVHLA
ncbi:MAG: SDR family NAD(P)-dependent oxidoreductase, partial [Chlamydiia bacterium]|nr:SDR family NAD(P)-dependent oxidoreductase [Chlamydiia bacterium]